jgi:hypothetical protein
MNGAIFYLFTLNYIKFLLVMSLVGTAAMFWVCSFMKKHKIAGTILYLLILAITAKLVVDKAFELSRENTAALQRCIFFYMGLRFLTARLCFIFQMCFTEHRFLFLQALFLVPFM